MRLLAEAAVVGLVVVAIGYLVAKAAGAFAGETPAACRDWNRHHIMEISLFLTGALTHLMFEAGGINRWYCANRRP